MRQRNSYIIASKRGNVKQGQENLFDAVMALEAIKNRPVPTGTIPLPQTQIDAIKDAVRTTIEGKCNEWKR